MSVRIPFQAGQSLDIYDARPLEGEGLELALAVVAGIHGNELNGVIVSCLFARYLRERPDTVLKPVRIIPLVNVEAFDMCLRSWPYEGMDVYEMLSSSSRRGAPSQIVAAELAEAVADCDFIVDIHSSNRYMRELPHVRVYRGVTDGDDHSVGLAADLSPSYVWAKRTTDPASFSRETPGSRADTLVNSLEPREPNRHRHGFIVMVGSAESSNKKDCATVLSGLHRFCVKRGILGHDDGFLRWACSCLHVEEEEVVALMSGARGAFEERSVFTHEEVEHVVSPHAGIFLTSARLGAPVKKGAVIGTVLRVPQGPSEPISAGCPGTLVAIRTNPTVYAGCEVARILRNKNQP